MIPDGTKRIFSCHYLFKLFSGHFQIIKRTSLNPFLTILLLTTSECLVEEADESCENDDGDEGDDDPGPESDSFTAQPG